LLRTAESSSTAGHNQLVCYCLTARLLLPGVRRGQTESPSWSPLERIGRRLFDCHGTTFGQAFWKAVSSSWIKVPVSAWSKSVRSRGMEGAKPEAASAAAHRRTAFSNCPNDQTEPARRNNT